MNIFVAMGLLGAAAHSPFQDGMIRRDTSVAIGDLEPANPLHQVELEKRLRKAARNVCGTAFPLDPVAIEDLGRCREAAFERAKRLTWEPAAESEQ